MEFLNFTTSAPSPNHHSPVEYFGFGFGQFAATFAAPALSDFKISPFFDNCWGIGEPPPNDLQGGTKPNRWKIGIEIGNGIGIGNETVFNFDTSPHSSAPAASMQLRPNAAPV